MADSRFNQVPGYPGGPPMGPQGGGMQPHFIQATRPMNPMMQQRMMMPFAMQGMRMAPPNTPPPPYGAHFASPGIVNLNQRPRTVLSKDKGQPKSDKERFFEEQRQKLKHFGKPGTAKVDTDSLIGAMFKPDPKPAQKGIKANNKADNIDDDDGFGDFLQGPSVDPKPPEPQMPEDSGQAALPEPATLTMEERKDLTSMMLECSDLSAPQKAKGFHKPSLNEVHRPGHERLRKSSFHESDHSRSWKQAGDLEGLFQLPAAVAMVRPVGPPPAYSEALNHPSSPIVASPLPAVAGGFSPEANGVRQEPPGTAFTYPATQAIPYHHHQQQQQHQHQQQQQQQQQHIPQQQGQASPHRFPAWCSAEESQLPPLYKQVLDASLVEGQIATERLYPILLLSGLPRERLAQIWSLCNTATPGQLVKSELWLVLALVAVAQNNIDTTRLDILTQLPSPPIPVLVAPQNGAGIPAASSSFHNGTASTPSSSPAPAHSPSPGPPMPVQQSFVAPQQQPQSPHPSQPQPQSQPQAPHHPASSPSLSLSSAAMSVASADDDFSDFQAGPSPSTSHSTQAAGKIPPLPEEESYGEFIGGGTVAMSANRTLKESPFQPCCGPSAALPHSHSGGALGNGVAGSHRRQPPTPPQPQPSLSALPPCSHHHADSNPDSHYQHTLPQQQHQQDQHHSFQVPAYQPPPDPNHHYHDHHHHHHHHRQHHHQQPPPPGHMHPHQNHHHQQQQQNRHQRQTFDDSTCPCCHDDNARLPHSPLPQLPPLHHHEPQKSLARLPAEDPSCDPAPPTAPPPIVPVDDKYGNNVRSFFCSSDSSTGHTSPSFEDDDFTDGRDSLSQISTSEQSENDDIRNFESYVEEFNHRSSKAAPAGSPLHCPFPSVQQPQGSAVDNNGSKASRSASLPAAGNHRPEGSNGIPALPQPAQHGGGRQRAETDSNTNSLASGPTAMAAVAASSSQKNLPTSSSSSARPQLSSPPMSLSSGDDFADFKGAQGPTAASSMALSSVGGVASSVKYQGTTTFNSSASGTDDFADFKSASIVATNPPSSVGQRETAMSSRGDDRYGALRSFDDDLMTSSVFESSAGSSNLHSGTEAPVNENEGNKDEEEWANFTEAPSDLAKPSSSFPLDVSATSDGIASTRSQAPSSSAKDDILKLFSAEATSKGTAMSSSVLSEGSASMVHSDSGYSTKSSFFDATPTSGGQPEPPSALGAPSAMSQAADSSWANFGADRDQPQQSLEGLFGSNPTVTISSGHEGDSSSEFGQFSSSLNESSAQSGGDEKKRKATAAEDDWGDFTTQTSSSSSSYSHLPSFPPQNGNSGASLESSGALNSNAGDWASFSTAPPDGGEGDGEENGAAANMVTIKKQNLGTNEILGLFKVRNDPATLSTYQLPSKPSPKTGPRPGKSGSGRNRSLSSDLDDDMVPPPMDSEGEDGDDEGYTYSRGYDLDDYMQRQTTTTTTYSPFAGNNASPYFSRAGKNLTPKVTGSNEDSGSVHSLELPSAKQYDSATNDSQSVSSNDLTSGQDPSNASGTWKSMESLDLPSDSADANEEVDKDAESPREPAHHPPHPIQPQELLASMPRLADKYNIDDEAQGTDRYRHEWERCLTNCCQILTEANTLFNNISSSIVCNEVLKASDGSDYVSCVVEIYRVGCRVMTSMSSIAISSNTLEQTLKQIDLVWNNLSAFLVGASLLPEPSSLVFKDAVLKPDPENKLGSSSQSPSACGLCLLDVDYNPEASSSSSSSSSSCTPPTSFSSAAILSSLSRTDSASKGIVSKLTFAGRQYHATCANFWVNCVDQTLPSLDLPDLL